MSWRIFHNPKCGTSRKVLAALQEAGKEPEVVEYLKTPPDAAELTALLARMGVGPRALLRRKGTPYDELGLDDPKWSDAELIAFMAAHPILIERPVVDTGTTARLCRPVERLQELLEKA